MTADIEGTANCTGVLSITTASKRKGGQQKSPAVLAGEIPGDSSEDRIRKWKSGADGQPECPKPSWCDRAQLGTARGGLRRGIRPTFVGSSWQELLGAAGPACHC